MKIGKNGDKKRQTIKRAEETKSKPLARDAGRAGNWKKNEENNTCTSRTKSQNKHPMSSGRACGII